MVSCLPLIEDNEGNDFVTPSYSSATANYNDGQNILTHLVRDYGEGSSGHSVFFTDRIARQRSRGPSNEFSVLVPNQKGYDMALAAGSSTMAMVAYATQGMAQKNVHMSREQAADATIAMAAQAKQDGTTLLATIATSFECPFDGMADPGIVADATARFLDLGVDMVVIADTIGAGNPGQVRSLMNRLVRENSADKLACHFHDTRALGMANVYAALESGVRRFDASIGGLGGCPFAPGASGNIATEDTVMMLEQMGFDTGIDLDALMRASDLAVELTGTAPGGRAKAWLKPHLAKQHLNKNRKTRRTT